MSRTVSSDAQVLLLLCAPLGQSQAPKPLNVRELHRLLQCLCEAEASLADLMHTDVHSLLRSTKTGGLAAQRLLALLERGAALGLAVESWSSRGIWVLSRTDDGYPRRLLERLGSSAPPILYGAGDHALLSGGGLALVGSRDLDDEALAFTHRLASLCARQGIPVVSGGARGVDVAAVTSALRNDGQAIGVLPNNLAGATRGANRDALIEGTLVLVSPYDPDTHFSIGNAMGRNKVIYALSDWALVVHSSFERGGTWAGAVENLKHRTAPLFVRSGSTAPQGNRRLIERGGIPLPADLLAEMRDLRGWFDERGGLAISRMHQERTTPPPDDAPQQMSFLDDSECGEP